MAGISSLNDTNAQNALNAVSPYCVAQDIEDKSKLPYTILAYGNIFDNGNATNSDGLIPIQPAIELDKLLNSNDGVYTKDAKCSLFELNNVSHGDFSGVVHPDTETYYLRKPSICLHSISTNNCESCSTRYENLNIKNIEDYYGAISSKLNLLSTSN